MTKIGNDFAALLLAFCLATPAFADEAPPRVTEAFQYVVSDTGTALEIDWAIDECCYLYRDKLTFASGDGVLIFGQIQLPEGQPHEDEFFGKQQVYRDRFFVTIPYTVEGDRPQTAKLIIKSQGCNDVIGICYPPQTWTDEVKLRKVSAGTPKRKLGQLGDTSKTSSEFPPADEVFFPEAFPVDGNAVEVGIRVVPGFYLYKDKISVRSLSDGAKAGRLDLPKGKMKVDEYFGEMEVYLDSILAPLAIARATPDAMDLELELKYQGCAEGGLCYMPQTRVITVSLPEASTVSDLSALPSDTAPVSEQARLAQIIMGSSIWVTIGLFFLAGLGLAFTPCVLPMVPILSGIIAGEGDDVTPMRGFTLALSYVLGMALVYTGAGIAAAAAGLQLQATFNQPWVLILFAGVFVILALGMFGAYELQMPSSIQGKVSSVSGKQKSGTMIGAFVMGACCPGTHRRPDRHVPDRRYAAQRQRIVCDEPWHGRPATARGRGARQAVAESRAVDGSGAKRFWLHDAWTRDMDVVQNPVRQRNDAALGRADLYGRCIHGWPDDTDTRIRCCAETRQGVRLPGDHLRHHIVAGCPDGGQQSAAAVGECQSRRDNNGCRSRACAALSAHQDGR